MLIDASVYAVQRTLNFYRGQLESLIRAADVVVGTAEENLGYLVNNVTIICNGRFIPFSLPMSCTISVSGILFHLDNPDHVIYGSKDKTTRILVERNYIINGQSESLGCLVPLTKVTADVRSILTQIGGKEV